jgi:DNA-binding MarR family transcriptional regulator
MDKNEVEPASFTTTSLGLLLIRLFNEFERELLGGLHQTPEFASITSGDHRILRCIGRNGSSVVEIARANGTTKQAASKAVDSLARRGFVTRRPHLSDGRMQVIAFTPVGERLRAEGLRIVASIERRYRRILGADVLAHVKESLGALTMSYVVGKERP